ncbi:MAG: Jag N-terminal domain-containing protein [Actinobacteria bacterium]|nr:Jag N-terminal domain-containing protein [Actinomycetota bacterium]
MEWIETTGATVDDAKERALDRLGVAEDELEYEILAEASRSMLGLKKTDARLRARVRPRQSLPRVERRDRDRNRRGGGSRGGGRNGRNKGNSRGEGGKQESTGRGNRRKQDDGSQRPRKDADRSEKSGNGPNRGSGDRSSRRRRRGESPETVGDVGSGVESTGDDRADRGRNDRSPASAPKGVQMELETQSEIVEEFVAGLLDEMGLDARVVSTIQEDRLSVEAQGLNLGLAIGHRGETVRAITEIARTIVQRRSEGAAVGFLSVDVGGYRERRRTFLEEFARNQAEAVLGDGRARALEAMGSADRKVIHDTVSEIDGVETESEGSDRDRRVVIRPVAD